MRRRLCALAGIAISAALLTATSSAAPRSASSGPAAAPFAQSWALVPHAQRTRAANRVVGRDGYDQITGFTHKGAKQVTFTWTKPYAAWQMLFSGVYPSAALAGQDFNTIWANCICGSDGKPVSDGPYSLTNYTKGQGSTLKVNPFWYGRKPAVREVDFKVISDTRA